MKKIAIVLILTLIVSAVGCSYANLSAVSLSADIPPQAVTVKEADDSFIKAQTEFAIELFQESVAESGGENVLISPLSVQLCLAMIVNGAKGETKAEMETVMGQTAEDLNMYLGSYVDSLPSPLKTANSIWLRDNKEQLRVEPYFLETNVSYYDAEIFSAEFDTSTVKDINSWVEDNTNGMIDGIINEIPTQTIMYLINAICFDGKWKDPYKAKDVDEGIFTSEAGAMRNVDMMRSNETKYIIDSGKAKGFIKDYKGGEYSFVALLPDQYVDIDNYINGLDAADMLRMVRNPRDTEVIASTPKFESEYSASMRDMLSALGMPSAFESALADFSGIGSSDMGNIYIGDVLHKTYISLDEKGTKAAAVTAAKMNAGSSIDNNIYVTLNRPFVYMIIHTSTGLPVFIGTVKDIVK